VGDVVRRVGGDEVRVTQLMGEGVDPHLYSPNPDDISKLRGAEMIFYSGLHLEGKMVEIFERMAARKPTVAVAEKVDKARLIKIGPHYYDPHIWFDVSLWSETIAAVEDALAEHDPQHADDYHTRADEYRRELAALHEECRKALENVPKERRVLVTAHDAFSYFGRAYDIEVRAIQGVSTDTEAGLKEINALVDFLVARKIKAVFAETSVNDRNMRALVEGCKERGHDVAIADEQLFSDAMGKPGTTEGTYPGMVRHNVKTIVEALK
jgi:manganese/zinc/iron transport system substrate-binding protein